MRLSMILIWRLIIFLLDNDDKITTMVQLFQCTNSSVFVLVFYLPVVWKQTTKANKNDDCVFGRGGVLVTEPDFAAAHALNREGVSRFAKERSIIAALNDRLVTLIDVVRLGEAAVWDWVQNCSHMKCSPSSIHSKFFFPSWEPCEHIEQCLLIMRSESYISVMITGLTHKETRLIIFFHGQT